MWGIKTQNNGFNLRLFINLIPSHKDSPNFWQFIPQQMAALYLIQMAGKGRRPMESQIIDSLLL